MLVPTKEELETALAEAARMREKDEDPRYVAKALLNHHYRLKLLEEVLDAARHYLHSGLAAHEHTVLEKSIKKAENAALPLGSDKTTFGLD